MGYPLPKTKADCSPPEKMCGKCVFFTGKHGVGMHRCWVTGWPMDHWQGGQRCRLFTCRAPGEPYQEPDFAEFLRQVMLRAHVVDTTRQQEG